MERLIVSNDSSIIIGITIEKTKYLTPFPFSLSKISKMTFSRGKSCLLDDTKHSYAWDSVATRINYLKESIMSKLAYMHSDC